TESELRGGGAGLRVRFGNSSMRVAGVISDAATNGYEMLMRGPVPAHWARVDSFLLVHLKRPEARAAVERRFESLLAPGRVAKVRSSKETPFLRYGDAVLPQLLIKETFGEFAASPNPDGTLTIDPAWSRRNIRAASVPILGRVTCHRTLFPQLQSALRNIKGLGLAYRVDPNSYGGCYGPRFIDRDPTGRISHHAWGIGVDLNVDENRVGARPAQDHRVVEEMMRWGFTWGGDWLRPDGMHFEWIRFP
ncbi:MAG: M15 family metallopeptidase, partial [Candidatus Rokuibacteriota bacterium]